MNVSETTVDGLRAVICESGRMRLALLPELGAKVISLLDLSTGREWLAAPEGVVYRRAALDADCLEYIRGGWDECFPSIASGFHPSGPWTGTRLADHGELWSRPWELRTEDDAIVTTIYGVRFPYRFERRITLAGDEARVDYEVSNLVEPPFACMWAMHPLLAAQPGMQILLPERSVLSVDFSATPGFRYRQEIVWPMARLADGTERDLSTIRGPGVGFAAKLFTQPLQLGRAALHDPASEAWLGMGFDTGVAPYLGLWLNEGGWPREDGLYHVALEPSTACADQLDTALRLGTGMGLGPHQTAAWRVTLTIGQKRERLEKFMRA